MRGRTVVRRATYLVAVGLAGPARADDLALRWHPDETHPILSLDPELGVLPVIDGSPAIIETVHRTSLAIGSRARASLEGLSWSDALQVPSGNLHDWRIAGHLDVELAWGVHLELDASVMQLAGSLDGRFDRGTVGTAQIQLARYFHWSGGRVAWISLGVEFSKWLGDEPGLLGQPRGTTLGLHAGTTF